MTEGQNPEGHSCPQWNWTKAFQLSICCVWQRYDGLFSFPCCCHTLVNQLVNYSLPTVWKSMSRTLTSWVVAPSIPVYSVTAGEVLPQCMYPLTTWHNCPATRGGLNGQTSTYVCIWEYVMQAQRQCMSARSRDKCMIVHVCVWKPFRCWQWRMEMKRSRTPGTYQS